MEKGEALLQALFATVGENQFVPSVERIVKSRYPQFEYLKLIHGGSWMCGRSPWRNVNVSHNFRVPMKISRQGKVCEESLEDIIDGIDGLDLLSLGRLHPEIISEEEAVRILRTRGVNNSHTHPPVKSRSLEYAIQQNNSVIRSLTISPYAYLCDASVRDELDIVYNGMGSMMISFLEHSPKLVIDVILERLGERQIELAKRKLQSGDLEADSANRELEIKAMDVPFAPFNISVLEHIANTDIEYRRENTHLLSRLVDKARTLRGLSAKIEASVRYVLISLRGSDRDPQAVTFNEAAATCLAAKILQILDPYAGNPRLSKIIDIMAEPKSQPGKIVALEIGITPENATTLVKFGDIFLSLLDTLADSETEVQTVVLVAGKGRVGLFSNVEQTERVDLDLRSLLHQKNPQ